MAMENQRTHLLNLAFFCQSKDMEELRHSLLYTTLELETTREAAHEEIRRRDDQLLHLRLLLEKTIKEKENAQEKFQKLVLENLLLLQQQQFLAPLDATAPVSGVSSVENGPPPPPPPPPPPLPQTCKGTDRDANGFSSLSTSDSDESIVSSPRMSVLELVPEKPLPEKGKLLQAVMKAGPLLQTLLLAGPLPQWRHPPPPIEPFNIPPVGIPANSRSSHWSPTKISQALVARKGGFQMGPATPQQQPSTKD